MSLVSATYDRWEQQHPGFVELSQRLSRYSCESVLEGLATLQIYPENAPQTLRLQLFANIAVCRAGGARATLKDLERMFTNTALGAYEIIEQQDPFANAFVEEVGFLGLPYRCLPGIHEGPLFDFRQLLKALFMSYEPMFDAQALSELGEIVRWSLTLSDAILDRAGLSAVTWCPDGHRKTLSLSRGKNLAELCWFSDEELAAYGRPFGLSRETLLTLVVKPDEGPLNLGEGPLHRGPLVPTRGGYLVAMPAALWSAARHQIVSRVIAAGKGPELSDRLAAATLDTMEARFSHFEEIEEGTPVLPNGCYGIELEVDVYQRVLVIAACDTLENWDTGRSCGDRSGPLPEELTGAINEWIETIQVGLPGVHVMVCLCSVGVGRFGSIWGSLPQGQPGTVKNVCCRAEELDLVMWMEDGNLNAVILLQRHLALTREYNQVHYSCYLDLYAQYRIHRSFYFSDKGTPGMLVIPCDLSLAVRQQYDQRYNPQWVPYYAEPRVFVHVHRLRANEPVYFLTEKRGNLVDYARVHLWRRFPLQDPNHCAHLLE
jgi:hypothetical protein